jgi:hypothetical protein
MSGDQDSKKPADSAEREGSSEWVLSGELRMSSVVAELPGEATDISQPSVPAPLSSAETPLDSSALLEPLSSAETPLDSSALLEPLSSAETPLDSSALLEPLSFPEPDSSLGNAVLRPDEHTERPRRAKPALVVAAGLLAVGVGGWAVAAQYDRPAPAPAAESSSAQNANPETAPAQPATLRAATSAYAAATPNEQPSHEPVASPPSAIASDPEPSASAMSETASDRSASRALARARVEPHRLPRAMQRVLTAADASLRREAWSGAERGYRRVLRADDDNPAALAGLTRVALGQRDRTEALVWARKLVAAQPNDPQSHRLLSEALRASGQRRAARTSMLRAQRLGR